MLSLKLFEVYSSCDVVSGMTHHLPKLWAPLRMTSRAKITVISDYGIFVDQNLFLSCMSHELGCSEGISSLNLFRLRFSPFEFQQFLWLLFWDDHMMIEIMNESRDHECQKVRFQSPIKLFLSLEKSYFGVMLRICQWLQSLSTLNTLSVVAPKRPDNPPWLRGWR